VFDYLVDTVQRRTPPGDHVSPQVVQVVIAAAGTSDADSMAATAYDKRRYDLAVGGWRRACQAKTSDPGLGPGTRPPSPSSR
jgi:eukaryotic-like serine/threonine-protein kinase